MLWKRLWMQLIGSWTTTCCNFDACNLSNSFFQYSRRWVICKDGGATRVGSTPSCFSGSWYSRSDPLTYCTYSSVGNLQGRMYFACGQRFALLLGIFILETWPSSSPHRYVRGKPASQIAPKILGPAGTIVELAFKREQVCQCFLFSGYHNWFRNFQLEACWRYSKTSPESRAGSTTFIFIVCDHMFRNTNISGSRINSASLREQCSKLQRHFARTESKNCRNHKQIRQFLIHSGAFRLAQPAHRGRDDPKLARGKGRRHSASLPNACLGTFWYSYHCYSVAYRDHLLREKLKCLDFRLLVSQVRLKRNLYKHRTWTQYVCIGLALMIVRSQ